MDIAEAIELQIKEHESEITKLRQMKRIYKGSSTITTNRSVEDVVTFLKKQPNSTTNSIATALGLSYDQAADLVHVAQRKRLIENATPGQKRYVKWIVKVRKADPEKVRELQTKEKPKPKVERVPPPKRKRKGGGRITNQEARNREQSIQAAMRELNGPASAENIAERAKTPVVYTKKYLKNQVIMHKVTQIKTSVPYTYYLPEVVSERETKINPTQGTVEEGRKRSEPVQLGYRGQAGLGDGPT